VKKLSQLWPKIFPPAPTYEVEVFKCKFCQEVFLRSLYKDICKNCIKLALEHTLLQLEMNRAEKKFKEK